MKKTTITEVLQRHVIFSMVVAGLIGFFINWLLGWIIPSKPTVASNAPKKELTCILNYSNHLVKKATSSSKLQILYDGQATEDPVLYDITIENSGNQEIENEDFKENFVIAFDGCGRILNAQVRESTNHFISEEVLSNAEVDGENLIFSDFFLNPDESFSVIVITDKRAEKVTYGSRISGVSNLTLRNAPKERLNTLNTYKLIITLVVGICLIYVAIMVIWIRRSEKKSQRELEKYMRSILENK